MSASHSILLLELEELRADMNTMQAEMSKCVARVEKVIASVRNVQPGEVSESVNTSVVKDNIVDLVGSRFDALSDIDSKDNSLERVKGTNNNLDCVSSRPSIVRNCRQHKRNKGDISEDKIHDTNSNTITEATNKVSIPTKIVKASLTVAHGEASAIFGFK